MAERSGYVFDIAFWTWSHLYFLA